MHIAYNSARHKCNPQSSHSGSKLPFMDGKQGRPFLESWSQRTRGDLPRIGPRHEEVIQSCEDLGLQQGRSSFSVLLLPDTS